MFCLLPMIFFIASNMTKAPPSINGRPFFCMCTQPIIGHPPFEMHTWQWTYTRTHNAIWDVASIVCEANYFHVVHEQTPHVLFIHLPNFLLMCWHSPFQIWVLHLNQPHHHKSHMCRPSTLNNVYAIIHIFKGDANKKIEL